MDGSETNVHRRAIESLINGTAPMDQVVGLLYRAALSAEDFLLATGGMRPEEKGTLWMDAKRCFLCLRRSTTPNVVNYQHQARRLREIARMADEGLAMDPWAIKSR